MTFRVGQKVVCVAADFSEYKKPPPNLPLLDEVYTLRNSFSADGQVWWRLIEIRNPPAACHGGKYGVMEPAFAPWRFRPIVERKTEISFTAGADPSSGQFDNRRKVRVRA